MMCIYIYIYIFGNSQSRVWDDLKLVLSGHLETHSIRRSLCDIYRNNLLGWPRLGWLKIYLNSLNYIKLA